MPFTCLERWVVVRFVADFRGGTCAKSNTLFTYSGFNMDFSVNSSAKSASNPRTICLQRERLGLPQNQKFSAQISIHYTSARKPWAHPRDIFGKSVAETRVLLKNGHHICLQQTRNVSHFVSSTDIFMNQEDRYEQSYTSYKGTVHTANLSAESTRAEYACYPCRKLCVKSAHILHKTRTCHLFPCEFHAFFSADFVRKNPQCEWPLNVLYGMT